MYQVVTFMHGRLVVGLEGITRAGTAGCYINFSTELPTFGLPQTETKT